MNYIHEENREEVKKRAQLAIQSIRDYDANSKMKGFVVGMSGGLDCAVVAALCHHAQVELIAITMPYEKEKSKQREVGIQHALLVCEKFHIELIEIDITQQVNSIYQHTDSYLSKSDNLPLSKANVLPRIRMTELYYVAQALNRLVLGTGNLSEITMGYFTKWGDGASDFNPVKQFTKTEMFELAEYLQVPDAIVHKKPSADLWDNQSDEEEMGLSYEQIDHYIKTQEGEQWVQEKIENAKKRSQHKVVLNMFSK